MGNRIQWILKFAFGLLAMNPWACIGTEPNMQGCYLDDAINPIFTTSAGESDPTLMNPSVCSGACQRENYRYCGIQDGTNCFCSNDIPSTVATDCSSPCSDNSTSACGGANGLTSVYDTESLESITGLTLSADNLEVTVMEAVTFQYGVESGTNVKYKLDYADGEIFTSSNDTSMSTHTFSKPGEYIVVLFGIDVYSRTAYISVTISVVQTLQNILVSCPSIVAPLETFFCNFTTLGGPEMSMAIDMNDDSSLQKYSISETRYIFLGHSVPQFQVTDMQVNTNSADVLMLGSFMDIDGYVVGFEAYMAALGSIDFMVLTPCSAGEFCYSTRSCSASCTSGSNEMICSDTFYPISDSCQAGIFTPSPASYSQREKYTATISVTGYQYIDLRSESRAMKLYPGDVVAFQVAGGAIVAYRNATSLEMSSEDTDKTAGVMDGPWTDSNYVHYARAIVALPATVSVKHTYNNSGNYTVDVTCTSDKGNAVQNSTVVVVAQKIGAVIVTLETLYWRVGSIVNVTATVINGSDFTIEWDFGDGSAKSTQINGMIKEATYFEEHVYATDGVKTVTVTAWNIMDNKNDTHDIYIQHPILEPVTVSSNSPQLSPPGSIIFTVNFPVSDAMPTNATIVSAWGDNDLSNDVLPVNGMSIELSHDYAINGEFNVSMFISNNVSNITLTTQVETFSRIEGLGAILTYWISNSETSFKPAVGDKMDTVEPNSNVSIHITHVRGTIVSYSLYKADSSWIENSTENVFYFQVTEVGNYNLTVYAFNPLQQSDPLNISIIVEELTSGLEINDFVETTNRNETKFFELSFGLLTTDMCVVIYYGDESSTKSLPEAYGDRSACAQNYTDDEINFFNTALQSPMNLTHTYKQCGQYTFNSTAFSITTASSSSLTFTVTDFPCPKPKMILTDRRNSIATAKEYIRSEGVSVHSQAIINCTGNVKTTKLWKIYSVDDQSGFERDVIDISKLKSKHKSIFYVPPLFLPYGYYKFVYLLTITVDGMDKKFPWSRSFYTYIRVVPSPLIAGIIQGSMSEILRGNAQMVDLNPALFSIDPDFPDDNNFNVTWFCRRVSPQMENFTMIDGKYDVANKVYVPVSNYSKTGADQGGCFGTGAGVLDLQNVTRWMLNTSLLFLPLTSYEILVLLSKGIRETSASLVTKLVDGMPPSVMIQCQNTEICFPLPDGFLINPTNRLGLIGHCIKECDGPLEFKWSVYDYLKTGESEANNYVTETTLREIAIYKEFFSNNSGSKELKIALSVSGPSGDGSSIVFLHLNQPPEQGSCSVTPTTGMALLDNFVVKCSGWIDPELHRITIYTFYIVNDCAEGKTVLASGLKRTEEVILPIGTVDLMVDISDQFGATTTVNIGTFNLTAPSQEDYKNFTSSEYISNLVGGGNQDKIVQVFLAIASLEKIYELEAPSNSNETLMKDEATEYRIQKSERISELLEGIDTLTTSSLTDIEMVSSAMSAVVGMGDNIDVHGKKITSIVLDNLGNILELNVTLRSPQEVKSFAESTVAVIGALTKSIAKTLIDGDISPADVKYVDEIDYDTDIGDYYDFQMPLTLEDMHREAIRKDTAYNGESQVEKIERVFSQIGLKVLSELVPNEDPIVVETDNGVNAMFGRYLKKNVSHCDFSLEEARLVLPEYSILSPYSRAYQNNESVGVQMLELPSILQSYGKHVDLLAKNTKTVKIELFDDDNRLMTIKNLTQPVDVFIPRMTMNGTVTLPPPMYVTPVIKWYEYMVYHQFTANKIGSSVSVEITPEDPSQPLLVFVRFANKPTLQEYDSLARIIDIPQENGTFSLFLSSSTLKNQIGKFYLGIAQLNISYPTANYSAMGNLTQEMLSSTVLTTYKIRIYTSGCYYYDDKRESWEADGCWVHQVNYSMTHCKCNHLTTFGSGFFIAPSTVDFDYVFAHTSFNENITIYMTLIITFVGFIIMIIWARWKDRMDLQKLGATPLPDNQTDEKYIYEILVSTGSKQSAATDSKVYFILSGERDQTEVRRFGDDKRKLFRKGEVDVFVMTVPRSLGPLSYMRVWHDNSGKGKYGSWYLNYIVVRDVQSGDKFEFLGNTWFAVEEGDGSIDRVLSVAGEAQLTEFDHLFTHTTRRGIADNHLWFSVFLRPPRSRFNRVQRVGCCVAFLYLSMLVNAMWYNTTSKSPEGNIFTIGPFSISTQEIGVGLVSNIIVFLPNFVIVYFFRKARPRKLRSSRIEDALNKQRTNIESDNKESKCDSNSSAEEKLIDCDELENQSKTKNGMSVQRKLQRKKKFTLPWMFQILAWLMVFLCILTSVFFLWSYGVTFGNAKTKKWVTALIISFFSSVLITEPIKLFLVAMLCSAICKRADDDDEDDADEDEEDPNLQTDEEYLHKKPLLSRKAEYQPPNPIDVSKARETRLKEIKMWAILREIIGYLLFLWVLIVISYGNRDPNSYHLKQTLSRAFIRQGKEFDFTEMKSTAQFWNWTRAILVPRLRADNLYNNKPPFGYKGFLHDQVNRLMGHAVMRQIRINRDECVPPMIMENISHPCSGTFTRYSDEDHLSYDIGWKQATIADGEPVTKVAQAFRYRTAEDINGIVFVGNLDIYSGGGYVFELTGKTKDIKKALTKLEKFDWLDRFSRAVLIEFSVYNTQVNLFGVCSIQLEFVPGGGFFQDYRFDGIRLLQYHDGFGLIVLICEITFVIFVLYFMVSEIIELCKEKKAYFTSYWNLAEVCMILLSIGAIIVYVFRMIITKQLLKDFNRTKGNKYINLQFVYLLNQTFGYFISFVVFLAIVKFIKLLRFNKRIGILSRTLAHAWAELAVFGSCFLIVFFAFAQLFYLIMSSTSVDFAGFLRTVEYTFSMMLNKFNFKEMNRGCPILGPIAFFIFALMTSIVLVNLFLTIVIKSFKNVAHDVFKQPNDYEIVDFILSRFKSFIGFGRTPQLSLAPNAGEHVKPVDDSCKARQLSDRVEILLGYINDVYFDGKISLDEDQSLKSMIDKKTIYTDTN